MITSLIQSFAWRILRSPAAAGFGYVGAVIHSGFQIQSFGETITVRM